MSDRKYILPGMPDWTFTSPTLQHKGGAGFLLTSNTSAEELSEGIKKLLRGTTRTPDEVAFEAVVQAAMKIDWKIILNPYAPLTAPLINAVPLQSNISTELIDQFCEHLKAIYFPLQEIKKLNQ